MSIDYRQYCIVGFRIDRSDVERVISAAQYVKQPRFDIRTGKETHKENVLVKQREVEYEWQGIKADEFYELAEAIAEYVKGDFAIGSDDSFVVGYPACDEKRSGYSRVDLLEGSIDFSDLELSKQTMEDLCPNAGDAQVHFVYWVG